MKSAARELGVSPAELHNILRRGQLPKRETLFRLAKGIGISNTHAYILAELSRPDTPDRIIELLNFYYEKTIDRIERTSRKELLQKIKTRHERQLAAGRCKRPGKAF